MGAIDRLKPFIPRPLRKRRRRKNTSAPDKPVVSRRRYIAMRKAGIFLGWYPWIHGKHFYYERPNSFMAPKIFEFVNMMRMTQLRKSDTVLDLGCGEGTLTFMLGRKTKQVIGVDIGEEGVEEARYKARELEGRVDAVFHCEKIEKLGLAANSIDKVFSFSVIEHIPNYLDVMEELSRILTPGGELIVSVDSFTDIDAKHRDLHQARFDVQKYFSKDELRDILEQFGFVDISIKPIFQSRFAEKWFIRVMEEPDEFFGWHKRLYSLLIYFFFVFQEGRVRQEETGIFLLARAVKASPPEKQNE